MNVVGRVGSLISQGVYSVATPFHPFGGAVDIIVVEQEDGTYRSTPWYVRFGKFQGVIKGPEKVVSISVNGVQASFHMYLDHSGQAYFMREVGSSDTHSSGHASAVSSPHKSCQGDAVADSAETNESAYEEHEEEEENDDGLKDDHSSMEHSSAVSTAFSPYSYGNLEEVEEMVKSSNDSNSEMLLISVDGHVLTAPVCADEEASSNYVQSTNPQFHLGPGEGTNEDYCAVFTDLDASTYRESNTSGQTMESPKDEKRDSVDDEDTHKTNESDTGMGESTCASGEICKTSDGDMGLRTRNDDMFKSCLDLTSQLPDMDLQDIDSTAEGSLDKHSPKSSSSEIIVEKDAVKGDSNCENTEALEHVYIQAKVSEDNNLPCPMNLPGTDKVIDSSKKLLINENRDHLASVDFVSNETEKMASKSGRSDVERGCDHQGTHRMTISELGFELSLCGNLLRPGMGRSSAEEAFEAHRISEKEFKASGPSIIKNGNLIVRYEKSYLRWAKAAYIVLGKAAFGPNFSFETPDSIPIEVGTPNAKEDAYEISPSSRGWRLWPIPFRRAASLQHSNSNSSSEEFFVDSETALQSPFAEQSSNVNNMSPRTQSPRKQLLRTYIPTTEQIASLNLKDGQNIIAFSFSTRVLGKQEVDAHIYLWKWNARIVISDVDGTITKSDVLGQVMPLVGKDWTQSGVAGLFSAIKENGYQLLFLSARAIVQAYLTRSFLLNLKQDGKALPSGPIVISPDGLFPSLFREVIRRAPHEFKIACLEDIRALFPSDYNPFYAGFGNRDTDELSYRKIGIPKGKIFIINPKGEVAINHCVDVKSYTSLHTLVNDMFPSTSLVEQEDFNNWNYWKVPLPIID